MSLSNKLAKQYIIDSMGGRCAYCGCDLTNKNFTIDHLNPRFNGGGDDAKNLLPVCKSCNCSKRTNSLEWYRIRMSIKLSKFEGILTVNQYLALKELGVKIDLIGYTFYFEMRKPYVD